MAEETPLLFGIRDASPDGTNHVSSEILRAQLAGIYEPCLLPAQYDHLHFGLDIILVMHGKVDVIIGDQEHFQLESGDIFIIPGGNRHRTDMSATDHYCNYGMEIPADYFAALTRIPELQSVAERLSQVDNPFPVRLIKDPAEFHSLRGLFEKMYSINSEDDTPCRIYMLKIMYELMALYVVKILRHDTERVLEHPLNKHIFDVRSWLDGHFADPIRLSDMAQMANLSISHFSKLFRKVTGMSPKAYLSMRRLEYAAFLLRHTSIPITNIVQSVGYNDHTNFTCAFTRYMKSTPSDYRKKSLLA